MLLGLRSSLRRKSFTTEGTEFCFLSSFLRDLRGCFSSPLGGSKTHVALGMTPKKLRALMNNPPEAPHCSISAHAGASKFNMFVCRKSLTTVASGLKYRKTEPMPSQSGRTL